MEKNNYKSHLKERHWVSLIGLLIISWTFFFAILRHQLIKTTLLCLCSQDALLAEIMSGQRDWFVNLHEHDSLLENLVEQELTEEEKKAAWEEYENEKKGLRMNGKQYGTLEKSQSSRSFIKIYVFINANYITAG